MSDLKPTLNGVEVTTGEARLSFPHLLTPQEPRNPGDKKKYNTVVIVPKEDEETCQALLTAVERAKETGKTTVFGGRIPTGPSFKVTLRDGDDPAVTDLETHPEYKGCYYFSCSAGENRPPHVVDGSMRPITDQDRVYGGVYARVNVRAYPYSHPAGGKGITFGLNAVQIIRDGDPLGGGRKRVEDVFTALAPTGDLSDIL